MAHSISDECVSCGACAGTCPVEAISEGPDKYSATVLRLVLSVSRVFRRSFAMFIFAACPALGCTGGISAVSVLLFSLVAVAVLPEDAGSFFKSSENFRTLRKADVLFGV